MQNTKPRGGVQKQGGRGLGMEQESNGVHGSSWSALAAVPCTMYLHWFGKRRDEAKKKPRADCYVRQHFNKGDKAMQHIPSLIRTGQLALKYVRRALQTPARHAVPRIHPRVGSDIFITCQRSYNYISSLHMYNLSRAV